MSLRVDEHVRRACAEKQHRLVQTMPNIAAFFASIHSGDENEMTRPPDPTTAPHPASHDAEDDETMVERSPSHHAEASGSSAIYDGVIVISDDDN